MRKKTFKDTLNKHNLSVNDFLDLRDEWDALSFSDRKGLIMDYVVNATRENSHPKDGEKDEGHQGQLTNLNLIDHYRENLYEVLELFRKTIYKDFDDWKDAYDWLFSNLNLTEKDISDIYKGRSIVYVASCRKENK